MAIRKDIEVKVWYSIDDGGPVHVGTATVSTKIENGKVSLDASNLRGLSEEIVSALEKDI